jgi:crotonobetainyl-CoA:carnitine CoA-transferase CaiB-like acyl-CoA transferase
MSAATAIMAALLARTADGLGRTVSSSLLEFALSCFTSYAADILETGTSPGLLGNDSPQFAPYGVFRCRDGSLALAGAGSAPLWLKLCDVLGRPDWAADPRFATNADRLRHRAELTAEIERVLTRDTAAHWQQALDGAGIPASPVLPPAAALASAQAEALQIRQAARTPDGYGYQTVRPPLSVASHPDEPAGPAGPSAAGPSTAGPSTAGPSTAGPSTAGPSTAGPSTADAGVGAPGPGPSADGTLGYSRGAPALGQHTAEILREAGLDAAEITDLAVRGIVAG